MQFQLHFETSCHFLTSQYLHLSANQQILSAVSILRICWEKMFSEIHFKLTRVQSRYRLVCTANMLFWTVRTLIFFHFNLCSMWDILGRFYKMGFLGKKCLIVHLWIFQFCFLISMIVRILSCLLGLKNFCLFHLACQAVIKFR